MPGALQHNRHGSQCVIPSITHQGLACQGSLHQSLHFPGVYTGKTGHFRVHVVLSLTSVPVDGCPWTIGCFQVQGPVDLNLEDMLSQEGHVSATKTSCFPTSWSNSLLEPT